MNVLRSREVLRLAASLSRFALTGTGVQTAGTTSRGSSFSGARSLCQLDTRITAGRTAGPPVASSPPRDEDTPPMEDRAAFHARLGECLSPSDVLDLVDRCALAHWTVSSGLTRMWHTTKKMADVQRRLELRLMAEHPTFERLCHRARADAPRMPTHDLALTLLALVRLGVAQGSFVVQTVLRVIQERLNDFRDEKALSILAACLVEMEPSTNTDALKDGLKLVLEERVSSIRSVVLLHTMMRLFGRDASPAIKHELEVKALSLSDSFTLPNAQYMLDSLASMRLRSRPLLDVCSKRLAENVHSIPFTRLMMLLKACRELRYRNLALFTSISDHLAGTLPMWTNKQVLLVLLEFRGLRFRPAALMDAFAERIVQETDRLTLRDLLAVLKCYSFLNHHLKENQEAFLRSVTQVLESYLPQMSSMELLKALGCLCVYAHFPRAPLERILQRQTLDELLQRGGRVEHTLRTLDLCLRLDRAPPSAVPLPLLQCPSPPPRPAHPALIDALRSMAGRHDVAGAVVEEGIHVIDCVVTPGVSGPPEDRRGPPHHPTRPRPDRDVRPVTRVPARGTAVLCVPPSSLCFGTTHPCGPLALKVRHLGLLGYRPVLVPLQELDSRTGDERIHLLKRSVFGDGDPGGEEDVMENSSGV